MLLRILLKIITLILGIASLNVLCWSIFLINSKSSAVEHPMWINSICSYFNENLFIQLYNNFPFSWIISLIAFVSFLVYDYLNYDRFKMEYAFNIKKNLYKDLLHIFYGLLIVFVSLMIIGMASIALQGIYLFFIEIPLISITRLKFMYNTYGNSIPENVFYNNIVSIFDGLGNSSGLRSFFIRIFVLILLMINLYLLLCYKAPKNINWVDYDKKINTNGNTWFSMFLKYLIDRFIILFKIVVFIYLLFIFPTTFLWLYPIVLIWFGFIPMPVEFEFTFPFYVYSLISILVLIKLFFWIFNSIKKNKKRKLLELKEGIKKEILNDLNALK